MGCFKMVHHLRHHRGVGVVEIAVRDHVKVLVQETAGDAKVATMLVSSASELKWEGMLFPPNLSCPFSLQWLINR